MHQGGDCKGSSPLKSYGNLKSGKNDYLEEVLTKVSPAILAMKPTKKEMSVLRERAVPPIIKREEV
jgi:hypothetical protein